MSRTDDKPPSTSDETMASVHEAVVYALRNFVEYYDQAGIGECTRDDENNPPDGFDGDEVLNVREGRQVLRRYRRAREAAKAR